MTDVVADLSGQYIINDASRVKALNNAKTAINGVSAFIKDLKITDPKTPHLFWLQDFLHILKRIKKILEILRLKVSAYNTENVAPIIMKAIEMIKLGENYDPMIGLQALAGLNIRRLQNYPVRAFGVEIQLGNYFGALYVNYGSMLSHFKNRFLTMADNWLKLLPRFTEMVKLVDDCHSKIEFDMKSLKSLVEEPLNATKNIRIELDFIKPCLYAIKIDSDNSNEIMKRVFNINHALEQSSDFEHINAHKEYIETFLLKTLHDKMESLSMLMENVLGSEPTMLYNLNDTLNYTHHSKISIYQFIVHEMHDARTEQTWLKTLTKYLEDNMKFLCKINVEICILNEGDIKLFIERFIKKDELFEYVQQIQFLLIKFFNQIEDHIIDSNDLLPTFKYNYKMIFSYAELFRRFQPNVVNELNDIMKTGRNKMKMMIESKTLSNIKRRVSEAYEYIIKMAENIREKMVLINRLARNFSGDLLKIKAESHFMAMEYYIHEAIKELNSEKFLRKSILFTNNILKKVNRCSKTLQRDLDTILIREIKKKRVHFEPIPDHLISL